MDHDDLRLAGNHGVALGHAHRHEFMGDGDRLWMLFAFGGEFRQTVDDRPKVRAAVAKKILDSARAEDFQISLADGFHRYCDWFVYFHRVAPRLV